MEGHIRSVLALTDFLQPSPTGSVGITGSEGDSEPRLQGPRDERVETYPGRFEGGTYWVASFTSTEPRHEFLYPTSPAGRVPGPCCT